MFPVGFDYVMESPGRGYLICCCLFFLPIICVMFQAPLGTVPSASVLSGEVRAWCRPLQGVGCNAFVSPLVLK